MHEDTAQHPRDEARDDDSRAVDDLAAFARFVQARPARLSSGGLARREEMRDALRAVVEARGRRSTAMRWSLAAALVLGAVGSWQLLGTEPGGGDPVDSGSVAVGDVPASSHTGTDDASGRGVAGNAAAWRHMELGVVRDQPNILQRSRAVGTAVPAATRVDDAELLALLREANRPTGLIRLDGLVILTRDVTDDWVE